MTAKEIMQELEQLGEAGYKNTMMKHGVPEPLYGVKIEHLKKIRKREKNGHATALELYATGNYDARYLAGLLVDPQQISAAELQKWAETANCGALQEYTVAWVAAESPHGWQKALEWIDSENEGLANAGWATLGDMVAMVPDEELDIAQLGALLQRVEKEIHGAPNRVRYTMNGYVIGLGVYVAPLAAAAQEAAERIGKVTVYMGQTACKVPMATEYIAKSVSRSGVGKKRKSVRCM